MTKMIKTISSKELENQKKIFGLIMIAIFLIGIFYIYFVGVIIFQIINKNNNNQHFQSVSSNYQQLEEKYFEVIKDVDLDHALSLGFVEQGNGEFVVRQTTVAQR